MPSFFSAFLFKNRPAFLAALALSLLLPRAAFAGESLPERTLAGIVDREKRILGDAAKSGEGIDAESFRVQVQGLCSEYEILLRENPNFAAGYACYGYLLSKMDMPRQAIGVLLKANQLDPNIPLVKNQIGNFLAEQGKPIDAENYYMAAIKLDPDEPLYHYQLGQLAPDRIEFTYRYAESFNDLKRPDWDKALKVWASLEDKETSDVGRQIIRLQAANVLIKEGKYDAARVLIATVSEPKLGPQKQKLVAQLPENAKH